MSRDLLATAERLASPPIGKPTQSDLKRSISTAYYVLFHAIAADGADRFIGTGRHRSNRAWTQVFRALQHGEAKAACAHLHKLGFPTTLVEVGLALSVLQERRHTADYDPLYRVSQADALAAIAIAEDGVRNLRDSSIQDRKAFAALLLLKRR